jgi:DNA-binding Lrp family transcriptional regulator
MEVDTFVEEPFWGPVHGFVLIQTETDSVAGVIKEIRQVPGVSQADAVTGAYDIVARAEAATIDGLAKIDRDIQVIPNVIGTLTCHVINVRTGSKEGCRDEHGAE